MRVVFVCALVIGYASAQYVKSGVKGGYGGHRYHNPAGENLVSLFGNKTQGSVETIENLPVGVCFKEVPTVSLVKDPRHVPAGNGSRPDLSVIRSCCPGYERNIHNYRLCEPVCTNECVSSICTAPETCTCYPDHVRNYAGICVPTCPIGCPNGRCAGGECICNNGFILDRDSKYCRPTCKDNCGGIGTCTGPNICSCRSGYQSTPEGSCKPACDRCINGDCVAPNDCRCQQGYTKDTRGDCISQCANGCKPSEICVGPNTCTPVTHLIPGQVPQQSFNQGLYPGYPSQRNQTSLPYYPSNGLNQNSTPTYIRPEYPHNHPYYPYPGQNPNDPAQPRYPNQYPGDSQPNYIVQPIGPQSHNPPMSDNLLGNYSSTNVPRPYQPNQPGYYPRYQPGNYSGYQPGYYPGQQPGRPGYQPGYQPGPSPPHGPNQVNQTYPGYYYQQNSTFPNQYYPGQPDSRPGLPYQPLYPNSYLNQNNSFVGQYPFPYQGNTTSNQSWYPQTNYGYSPNGPSYPVSENLTDHQIYPSQHASPNYNEPNNTYPTQGPYITQGIYPAQGHYPTQGPYPTQERTTNQSPNLFNPYNSDYNQQYYGQQYVCSPSCINGDCVGENRCSCHRGYTLDHSDTSGARCKPVCIGGCVNGVCTAPNVCVCNEGYFKDTSVKGRMICVKRIRRSAHQ